MYIVNGVNKDSILINGKNYTIHKENSQKSEPMSNPLGNVNHWTAGDYDDFYDGYHFNIGIVNNQIAVVKTLNFNQKGQHLWGRNSGMIGITLCAMKDWVLFPTNEQLDTMAILNAEICAWKNINPKGILKLPRMKVTGNTISFVGGSQNFNAISDHREFAVADGYGASRQDINNTKIKRDYIIDVRQKTILYFNDLKADRRKFLFADLLKG